MLSYAELLTHVWSRHNPTERPFSTQYRSAIYAADDAQLEIAMRTGEAAARRVGGTLRTPIVKLDRFYRAEDYHQKYRLRRERSFIDELVARYPSDQAFVDSTTAALLNGYVGGHGRRRELEALLPKLALTPKLEQRVLARVP